MKKKTAKKERKVPFSNLWSKVKKLSSAWAHIRCSISGDKDTVKCTICNEEKPLGFRRHSTVLEMARKHYYKHELYAAQSESDRRGGGNEIGLFTEPEN